MTEQTKILAVVAVFAVALFIFEQHQKAKSASRSQPNRTLKDPNGPGFPRGPLPGDEAFGFVIDPSTGFPISTL